MTEKTIERKTKQKLKLKKGAKKQLVLMIISIFLMAFSVTQVYYLAKYTFGHTVSESKLKVYRWVDKLLERNNETTAQE